MTLNSKHFLWGLLCLLFFSLQSNAQNQVIDSLSFKTAFHSIPPQSIGHFDSVYTYHCSFVLSDTTTVSKFKVRFGTYPGARDFFEQDYVFDNGSSLPTGLSYDRKGSRVTLGLDAHRQSLYYLEIRAIKNDGNSWPQLKINTFAQ